MKMNEMSEEIRELTLEQSELIFENEELKSKLKYNLRLEIICGILISFSIAAVILIISFIIVKGNIK